MMDDKEIQNRIRQNSSLHDALSSNVISELNLKYCTGCSACAAVCAQSAITMQADREGFLKPQIDMDKCIMCGVCVRKCPQLHPVRPNHAVPVCYAVMADEATRMKSSSGGMFTIAASWILEQGGVVCGAVFDENFQVHHVMMDAIDQLPALRGSKYIQSNTGHVYRQIKEKLSEGTPVLFTGVPCQVAALYAVVGRNHKNLYTIDLMCHGVSSYQVLEKYLQDIHHKKPVKELYFKRKEPWGWGAGTSILFEDGTAYEQYHYFDPFFIAYHSGDSKNAACSFCTSNTLPRQGDLTMGDFWGIDVLDPDMNDYKGTSAVLINHEKGEHLFQRLIPHIAKYKQQPLAYVLAKNAALREQNPLSSYRNVFFDHLGQVDFNLLVYGCKYHCFYDLLATDSEKNISREDRELYLLAKTASEKCGSRQMVTWVRSPKFEKILRQFFGKRVAFGITTKLESIKENSILLFDEIAGKHQQYFLVLIQRPNDPFTERKLLEAGYAEGTDYIARVHLPIVIEHYDLSEGPYSDPYGNAIEGKRGVIGRIEFSGSNSRIILGSDLKGLESLSVTLGSNGRLAIGSGCRFDKPFEMQMFGSSGISHLHIAGGCTFGSGRIVLAADPSGTSVTINEHCSFGDDLFIEAGQGNKVVIGRDCMVDRAISMSSCQKISVYELSSGIESKAGSIDSRHIFIGEHTAIGVGCRIGKGTEIGSGSIINDNTHINSRFPNNCLVSGEPAAVIRTDVCWSRKVGGTMADCSPAYRHKTGECPPCSYGKNVLVISDGDPIGTVLVEELQKLGHNITLCRINDSFDVLGTSVRRIPANKAVKESFDDVYDTAMLPPEQRQSILPSVRCNKYILLSSTLVYADEAVSPVKEDAFDPMHYQPVHGRDSLRELYRHREAAAFQCAAENGIDLLAVRVPRMVNEREIYLTAVKAAQRAIQPGSLFPINTPVVFVRHLAEFLVRVSASQLHGAVNFSDRGMISQDLLHKKLCDIAKEPVAWKTGNDSAADIPCSPLIPDTTKAEKGGFQPAVTEEWLLPMIEYYAQPMLPYDVKYRLPLIE